MDNSDPFAEDLESSMTSPDAMGPDHRHTDWNMDGNYRNAAADGPAHGLEALSTAASRDHYSFLQPPLPADSGMVRNANPFNHPEMQHASQSPNQVRNTMPPPTSPSASITSSNNNINFLLNPSTSLSPPIDPNLQSPMDNRESSFTSASLASRGLAADLRPDVQVETDHEVAFLLRHFSEAPGQW